MSCCPGCNPECGFPPRRGEYSELCPGPNWDTEARKLGVGSREKLSQSPQLLPWPACQNPNCHGEPGPATLPSVKVDLRYQCTTILSWSQSCPPHTSHTSQPTASSLCFPLCSVPICLETMKPGSSRDTSMTAAKSILSRTQNGCLPGCGPSCLGAPESKGDGEMPLWFLERFHSLSAPTSTCIIRGHKGGQDSYLCEVPSPYPDGLLRPRSFNFFTF